MPLPITVSELRTDDSKSNVGKNTILIAMTRNDANYLKDILRYYKGAKATGETRTKKLCVEILDRMDECFP